MKFNSSNLTTELQTIYRSDQPKPEPLNYQKLIKKQQDVIKSLSNEILLLKSYVSLTFARQEALETAKKETSTKAALKDIAAVLGVSCEDSTAVLEAVKKNKELSIRRAEPIFVQKIKEVKVPITVEKVVYVDRIVEKVSKDYHTEKDSDDNQEELTCSSINKTYQSKKEVYNSNNYPSEHDKKRGGQQPESGYKQELRKQAYDPVGGPVKRRDRDGHKHYVKKDSNY